jgi:uncharacterized protein (DUF433 family)
MTIERHPGQASAVVRDRRVLGGEPTLRGTRIAVRSIVLAAQEYGGPEGVLKAYPHLQPDAVNEALAYYEQHREEIDDYIRENLADD